MKEMIRPYRQTTFGQTYEDKRFTKNALILADCSKGSAGSTGNCDTTADTGKTGYKSCSQVAKAGGKTSRRLGSSLSSQSRSTVSKRYDDRLT